MAGELEDDKSAYVVVVGDVGRSPRMCNHALSLAQEGYSVTLLGHYESEVRPDVRDNPRIHKRHLPLYTLNQTALQIPRLVHYVLKVIWQILTIWCCFPWWPFYPAPHVILLQNPPGVPALLVCYAYSLFTRAKFVIDWHNYGYTILALSLGNDHLLVKISRWIEEFVGRRVSQAFCVSHAMRKDLDKTLGILSDGVTVLYDRPGESFRPCTDTESSQLFTKLSRSYPELTPISENGNGPSTKRPAVLVSSTSWTPDEDFSILIDALQVYEDVANDSSGSDRHLPDLICIITGKGPEKEHYCQVIRQRSWSRVTVITPWLEPEDYPKVLASADLGVSLHASSSGVDLPMKVVDMFGCGLPVAAKRFPAIGELVKEDENGVLFDTSEQLAVFLTKWFANFGSESYKAKEQKFRQNLAAFGENRWENTWSRVAKPVLCT